MSLTLVSYDPVAQGSPYIAALEAAGITATITAAGLMVSDPAGAATVAADTAAILAQAVSAAQAAVDAYYAQLITAGWTYSGKVIEIDAASQGNITAQSVVATISTAQPTVYPWNTEFYWICADGSQLALSTAAAMLDMGSKCGAYVSALIVNAAALQLAQGAAATLAALAAIDITSGWPAGS